MNLRRGRQIKNAVYPCFFVIFVIFGTFYARLPINSYCIDRNKCYLFSIEI